MLTNQNRQQPLVSRQQCFVKNIMKSEPIHTSNLTNRQNYKKININNVKEQKLDQKNMKKDSLYVRRSYGIMNFNHENKTQFNNRGSIKDNVICSDAIIKNEKKKNHFLSQQKQKKTSQEKQLRKFPVNVNLYNKYLKTEQIADAYYFVAGQIEEAKKRENKKQQTIRKMKSLSRSKSKEQNLQFRNKEQINFNCVAHVQKLKQMYTKQIVPELMGTFCQQKNIVGPYDKNIQSFKTTNTLQTQSTFSSDKNLFTGKTGENFFQSGTQSQKGFFKPPKPTNQTSLLINSHQKPSIYTSRMFNQIQKDLKRSKSKSLNTDSLIKKLQKCKSTEEFLQKERVKVIKQAFIQNWRQGQNKQSQKYLNIYPCKHSKNLKQEKQKKMKAQERQEKQMLYGQKYFKKNPIQNLPESTQYDMLMERYNTLKQYQLQFSKIAKNKIKSCVISKY